MNAFLTFSMRAATKPIASQNSTRVMAGSGASADGREPEAYTVRRIGTDADVISASVVSLK